MFIMPSEVPRLRYPLANFLIHKASMIKGSRHTWVLEYRTMFCRQYRSFRWLVLALEIIADVLHFHPLDAWLAADVFDQPALSAVSNPLSLRSLAMPSSVVEN